MAIDQISPQSQNTAVGTATRNRVLRNTYGLLALSMIPTVIGAWIGVATRFTFFAGSPAISFIAFLAIAWGFMLASAATATAAPASCCCWASPSSWG